MQKQTGRTISRAARLCCDLRLRGEYMPLTSAHERCLPASSGVSPGKHIARETRATDAPFYHIDMPPGDS